MPTDSRHWLQHPLFCVSWIWNTDIYCVKIKSYIEYICDCSFISVVQKTWWPGIVIRQSTYTHVHTHTFSNTYASKSVYLPVVGCAKKGAETKGIQRADLTEVPGEAAARWGTVLASWTSAPTSCFMAIPYPLDKITVWSKIYLTCQFKDLSNLRGYVAIPVILPKTFGLPFLKKTSRIVFKRHTHTKITLLTL